MGKESHLWGRGMLLCDFKLTRRLGEVPKCIRFWSGDCQCQGVTGENRLAALHSALFSLC